VREEVLGGRLFVADGGGEGVEEEGTVEEFDGGEGGRGEGDVAGFEGEAAEVSAAGAE
jgi:hypothetical protein